MYAACRWDIDLDWSAERIVRKSRVSYTCFNFFRGSGMVSDPNIFVLKIVFAHWKVYAIIASLNGRSFVVFF